MSDQPMKHGHQHLPLGPDPIPDLGNLTVRAVLTGGAGDNVAADTPVPVRFDTAYVLNDPDNDVFAIDTTSVDDPDSLDRYRLQLVKVTGWYRVECVVGLEDSAGGFGEDGSAWLSTDIGNNNTMVDYQTFVGDTGQPYGPFLRTIGEYDAGAEWTHDGVLGTTYVNPYVAHNFPTIELGWDTMYLKVHYLGDMGDLNASPWVSSFLP